MTNSWGHVPEPPSQHQPRRRKGLIIGAVVAVLAVAAVAGGWFVVQGSADDGESAAVQAFTTVPETTTSTSEVSETQEETSEQAVETVTVTAEPEPEPRPESEPESESESERDRGSSAGGGRGGSEGDLRCDGRNVLVVTSVMSNSPSFDREVDTALAANPDAVVLEPGTCASLRSEVDGAGVFAVVVDYGNDVSALCAAEAAGGGYSRVLDNEASYRSPC